MTRLISTTCGRSRDAGRRCAPNRGAAGNEPWVATAQRVYDEFEDDGLLWLLWLLGVALLGACAALCAGFKDGSAGVRGGVLDG